MKVTRWFAMYAQVVTTHRCDEWLHTEVHHVTQPGYATREEAIARGFELNRADDFNVIEVINDQVVRVWWMDKVVRCESDHMAALQREIGHAVKRTAGAL